MRKLLLGLTAIATVALVLPAATTSASARTIIIKHGGGHHGGWHRGWHPHPHKVVIIKHRH